MLGKRLISSFRLEPPDGKRAVLTVSDAGDLRRWLRVFGFDLRDEVRDSRTTEFRGAWTILDSLAGNHQPVSQDRGPLWMESCRLGDWGTDGGHDLWLVAADPDPKTRAEQHEGWGRLMKLLASNAAQDPESILAKAFAMGATHRQHLLTEKGWKAKNYNVCAACGLFVSAMKRDDCYKVADFFPSGRVVDKCLLLCEQCGDRMKQEMQ